MSEQRIAAVEGKPQVLAASPRVEHEAARERLGEVHWAGEVPAYGPGMEYVDLGDRAADDVPLEALAHYLDLRQLGHLGGLGAARAHGIGQAAGGLRQPLCGDRAVGGLGGLLLSLLLGAAGAVAVEPLAHADLRGEDLLVVGSGVLDDVLGDSEGMLGGELLQAGLPVE